MKFMPVFLFLYDFKLIFRLIFPLKIAKERVFFIPQTPRRLGRGACELTRHGADVARGTTARMRRGAEATWQSRGWPTRGAGGAQGTDTWQEATRVHGSTWPLV